MANTITWPWRVAAGALAALALTAPAASAQSVGGGRGQITGNAFNPAISMILVGQGKSFSENPDDFEISGFALGGESGPGKEGLGLDESELDLSANVDDLFYGSVTIAFESEADGTEIEMEEVYIQTLGLPLGANLKFGRFFTAIGYLNEFHEHADDFADRPLLYKAFLGSQHNDDGVQLSVILPFELYTEVGGGLFRGDDFPAGGAANEGLGSQSAYLRLGGDVGEEHSWRLGFSYLRAQARGRETGAGEDAGAGAAPLVFSGTANLFMADFKYQWAPFGDLREKYFMLQGEFIHRSENGTYNGVAYNGNQSGWYAQAVYKIKRGWRVGYRHARMNPDHGLPLALAGTALDAAGRHPRSDSFMVDWSNGEFSRFRVQFNRDRSRPATDNQFMVQYILSLGAHGAHAY